LSTRNFDPVTRTLRKRGGAEENGNEEEDTVEKAIQGVADMILAEDAEREAQDLVSIL
jgi:coiled-coil domain-containing protein 12